MVIPNGVMMQFFHWYIAPDGSLWNELAQKANELAAAGITSLWLPPAYKGAAGSEDVGYGVYDRYDLGEFDQKGSIRTKYGTRDEYISAVNTAKQSGLAIYADIVLNHMMGADHQEEFNATPYDPDDRHQAIGKAATIKSWTHFTFPGRQGKYSPLEWHWWHFNATDYNAYEPEDFDAVYLFEGKSFDDQVDLEKGSFDYLMGCDLDVKDPAVADALKRWGEWYIDTIDLDGFRFDAVKHVRAGFFPQWMNHVQRYSGRFLFAVGEYWSGDIKALHRFIKLTNATVTLFDAPLHYNFHQASLQGSDYDISTIFDNTLVQSRPELAVTLVDNHDSQPLQSLESVVTAWFKPLAYALILLRQDGYPCIFYADYYGAHYHDIGDDGQRHEIFLDSHQWMIDRFLTARHTYGYGEQQDYFDHVNIIGWTRLGTEQHPGGMAVVLSNGAAGTKRMTVGWPHRQYIDVTGHIDQPIITDLQGWADFPCQAGSVSVWVPQKGASK
ncbi:MAG: alpha-amylase [Phormidesmis sp. RL_2_1]|nr:alpha-amylase [Phormidesmis sp. RL_2_1]